MACYNCTEVLETGRVCGGRVCNGYCSNQKCKLHILNGPDPLSWYECKHHGEHESMFPKCNKCTVKGAP